MATQTPKLALKKPTVGGDSATWGADLNSNLDTLDNANVLTVDTADQGYVFVPYGTPTNNAANVMVTSIDQTRTIQFVLPVRIIVRSIVTEITTGGGASTLYGVGIYDDARSLLVSTAAIDANTVAVNETSVTATTLEPGVYFWAWTSDSTTTQARLLDIGPFGFLNSGSIKKVGFGNASSAGVLPATLGTVVSGAFFVVVGMLIP